MSAASVEKLLHRLAQGKPVPAVVLKGTDVYLREVCRAKIIEAFVPPEARDWAVARLSAREASWEDILGRAQTVPMLARRQVVIVEGAESVEKLGEKSREEVLKALEGYFESPAPFTVLVIEVEQLDGRQRFAKLLQGKGLVVELAIDAESAPRLAEQIAQDLGAEIDREAAVLLAEILSGSPALMRIELAKLATYARGRRIGAADIEALVVATRKTTVWQLADLLASGRRGDALTLLDTLWRNGEQPAGIIGALAWVYRKLVEARDLPLHTGGYQAARQLGMRPESAEVAVRQAHRIEKADLLAGIVALAEADSRLKSADPNPRATLEFLITRLTSTAGSA
ncbi:MAG TPA: DNA polymerase III subunit delta [Candidatus Acidoferrales bacterium]|nr:DNA polymerase III subunit delta [Candidatus Acidoferrales bacterium]